MFMQVLISARHTAEFPVAIVRPSLVGCTARSPHPGYFGNNAGPTSIALAFALGIATFTSHKVGICTMSSFKEYAVYDRNQDVLCKVAVNCASACR